MRDSFIFYRSFYESIELLPDDIQLELYRAIIKFAIYDEDITDSLSDIAKALFIAYKPQIEINKQRYENGKKGGRPKKEESNSNQKETKQEPNKNQTETKTKPKENQKETKQEPNVNVNVNVNDNVNLNENVNANENDKERGEVLRKNNPNLLNINSNENANNEKNSSPSSFLEKNKLNQNNTKQNQPEDLKISNKSSCEKDSKLPDNVVPLSSVMNKITKNKSSPENKSDDPKPTLVDFNFAEYMRDYFKQKVSHFNISQKELEVWATYVAKIRRKFHANESDLIEVFKFAMNDPFWQQVIMNPYHLYKNWNKIILQKKNHEDPYYELKRKIAEEEKQEQINENIQARIN